MSLQVWLPLNGDLTNNGLSNYNLVMFRGSEVYNNNGKIGKCFYANGVNTIKILNIIPNFYNYTGYSLCAWFYIEGQNTSHSGSAIISAGNWNNQVLNLSVSDWSSDHYTRLRISGTNWNNTYTYNFQTNIWYHVVVSSDGNKTYAYVNGALLGDTASGFLPTNIEGTDMCIGGATYYSGMQFFGRINDVRIYDHVLSPKEVEELSKGLVLHYKLDDSYMQSAENIMPNYLEMALGSANASTGTWRLAGSNNMTRERVLITDSPEGECYGFQNSGIQTANDGSCYGIDNFPLTGNSVYTISMWARIIDGSEGYAGYNIYNSTDKGGSYTIIDKNYRVTPLPASGEWVKCWYTFTTNASNTRNIYIGITTGSTSVTTQMCCIHIEKVDNTVDTVIYDSSGYQHNGDLTNNEITSDTTRYTSALILNGTAVNNSSNTKTGAAYLRGFLSLPASDALTVTWWGKIAAYGRGGIFQTTNISDPSECTDHTATTIANWDSTFRIYNGSSSFNIFYWFKKDNAWRHHAIVFNGSSITYYCDGEALVNAAFTGPLVAFNGFCMGLGKAGGVYRQIKQTISDLRIYVTGLSPEQILELYHTSATIDNNGNMYSRELVEI